MLPDLMLYSDLSVCPSVCPPVRLPVRLSVCQSAHLSVCMSACPSICLPVSPSVCPSVCQSVRLSVRLSVCPYVCQSLRQFVPGGNARENPAKTRGFEVEKKETNKRTTIETTRVFKKITGYRELLFCAGGKRPRKPCENTGF